MIEEVSYFPPLLLIIIVGWFKDSYKSQIMIQYNH